MISRDSCLPCTVPWTLFASPFARDQAIAATIEEAELPRTFRFDKDSQAVLAFAIEQMLTVYFHRAVVCSACKTQVFEV